jgi:two-component system phosphate regulon response regulator OmpR
MPAKRVLCVDDDADTRDLLTMMLGFSDFEAVAAPDADAALRLMARERFGLYVLDGGLRGGKGLSLCERIRASDAHTPIVIFSGHASASDVEAGLRAGASAYLVKPDSSELVPTIRRLIVGTSSEESGNKTRMCAIARKAARGGGSL